MTRPMLEYETPEPLRWWERVPWRRVLVVTSSTLVVVAIVFVIIYLVRSG